MWRWVLPVAALAAVLIGFMASRNGPTSHVSAHATPTTTPPTTTPGPHLSSTCGSLTGTPRVRHVVWIWMGSQGYEHVITKNRIAPFTNSIASDCGLATAYSSITHPAIANDVGALAGDPHGLVHNACAPCTTSARSLLSQVSWRAFVGGMPGPCRKLDAGLEAYSRLNNPPTYLNVRNCQRYDLPLGTVKSGGLQRLLAANTLPSFTLIAPDNCHNSGFDKHCAGQKKRGVYVARSDVWLRGWVGALTASKAYQSGSMVIFVTWNQATPAKALGEPCTNPAALPNDCHVPLLVISPYVPHGRRVTTRFSHYSLLRATEQLLHAHHLLGHSADKRAGDLVKAFGL